MSFTAEELAEMAAFDAEIDSDYDFDDLDKQESYERELRELIAERESMGDRRSNPFPLSEEGKREREKRLSYLGDRIRWLSDPEYREHIRNSRLERIKLHPEKYGYDSVKRRVYYEANRQKRLDYARYYYLKNKDREKELRRNPPPEKSNTVCHHCGHPLYREDAELRRNPRGHFFCDRDCYWACRRRFRNESV